VTVWLGEEEMKIFSLYKGDSSKWSERGSQFRRKYDMMDNRSETGRQNQACRLCSSAYMW
jgi:hypothetical protein